jgi:hypothetical protein
MWHSNLRRFATLGVVFAASAISPPACLAVQLAYDDATHAAYADGWQGTTTNNETGVVESVGDNGGFGFEPWNFDTDWLFNPDPIDGIQEMDTAPLSPFNQIGTAWRMAVPEPQPNPNPPPSFLTGIPRAGRGFPALQAGQTFRLVFDNPTDRQFFKGYFIRFNSRLGEGGGGNICYDEPGYSRACSAANEIPIDAEPIPKLNLSRFEYFYDQANSNFNLNMGVWGVDDADNGDDVEDFYIPLFDEDTAAAGAQLDFTITHVDEVTGEQTYSLTLDPFGPAEAYTETGVLHNPGDPVDWIEFTFFNTDTDVSRPEQIDTDLFIRSMEIFTDAAPAVPGDYNEDGTVNAADYAVWRDKLGQTFQLPNEVSGVSTGMVTSADYTAWRERFGNTSGGGSTNGAVPEPATILYLIGAVVGVVAFGRRTMQ